MIEVLMLILIWIRKSFDRNPINGQWFIVHVFRNCCYNNIVMHN